MHLHERRPVVVGQAADAVSDVQLMLADNRRAGIAQQLVVVQQGACNSVLDGGHRDNRRILPHAVVDLLERLTADELQLLAAEILMGCDVVERARLSLYGYSLHVVIF